MALYMNYSSRIYEVYLKYNLYYTFPINKPSDLALSHLLRRGKLFHYWPHGQTLESYYVIHYKYSFIPLLLIHAVKYNLFLVQVMVP